MELLDDKIEIKYAILNVTCFLEYQNIDKIDYLNLILRMPNLLASLNSQKCYFKPSLGS